MKLIKSLSFSVLVVAALSSCQQQSEQKSSATSDSVATSVAAAPVVANDTTSKVYDDYIRLKDVLVASDAAKAREAGQQLASSLAEIQGCENTAKIAQTIASTSDIAAQRTNFTALSADIIALMKHTDLNSGKIFVQHCPMANDGEGGYWLSSQSEIRNPYYGDEMLECGSVKETITAK